MLSLLLPIYSFYWAKLIDFLIYENFHTSFILASYSSISLHIVDVCQSQSTAAENILGEMDMQNMLKGLSSGSHAATMVKLDNQNQKRPTSEKTKSPDALSSSVSVAVTPTVIVSSESNPSSSSASTPSVPPKGSNLNRAAKVKWIFRMI